MPLPGEPLRGLGFLTIGLFDGADPGPGHESTLQVIELGEQLGFSGAWLRHRHLQYGISSPMAVIAAASQRTSTIRLGTAVTPLSWENPLRFAEDLATVDILTGGRLNPGLSVGPPMHWERVRGALYPDSAQAEELGYERLERLLRAVGGEPVTDFKGVQGIEVFSNRIEPHSPGLAARMWYGGGSIRSARWAGEHAMSFLSSNVITADESMDFADIQQRQMQIYRDAHPDPARSRVSQGLVVIPTDSASAEQRAKYVAYAEARTPRTLSPQGPRQMLFARDIVGPAEEIAQTLYAHAGFRAADEVAFALPFTFEHADYVQILTDIATRLAPAIGWTLPAPATGDNGRRER